MFPAFRQFWWILSCGTSLNHATDQVQGLSKMNGLCGHPGWAWIFIVEGLISTFPASHGPRCYHDDYWSGLLVDYC